MLRPVARCFSQRLTSNANAVPLKLIKSRNSKTPNLYIRGAYLGVSVDKSCGTNKRSVAQTILKRIEGEIERGEYRLKVRTPRTFLSAALAYLEAGRRKRYVANLIRHFGETPLDEINQAAIDEAAVALHPNAGPGTRNAAVYTPMSAILRHAGVDLKMRRPRGAKGRIVTDWLRSEDADAIIVAADQIDTDFGTLLRTLLYTGLRLGEVLAWQWSDLNLDEGAAWTRREKGGIESDVKLRPDLVAALRTLGPTEGRGRVFRFHQGGHTSSIYCRVPSSPLLVCPALPAVRSAGVFQTTGLPSSTSTPSATPSQLGCADMVASIPRDSSLPAIGAMNGAHHVMPMR
jgi:Phage integrase family